MLLLEKCTVARTSLEVARCASHGGAVSACHSFASRDPMFSYFGQRVQDKPRKLLFQASKFALSLDKATMKVKSFPRGLKLFLKPAFFRGAYLLGSNTN